MVAVECLRGAIGAAGERSKKDIQLAKLSVVDGCIPRTNKHCSRKATRIKIKWCYCILFKSVLELDVIMKVFPKLSRARCQMLLETYTVSMISYMQILLVDCTEVVI